MKIRKMDATFGKLIRKSLELGDGLNIVCGDNESGKSTWCGFIRAMLYGINTREQSKSGFIADKERFRPWSGESMHGRMEVKWRELEIGIERDGGRSGVLQAPIVVDSKTGLVVPGMEIPGEEMLGVKKEVFERSAFIGQAQIKVENDKSGELERKISSMASSGDEDVSHSQAQARLKSWRNRRRYHNRGEAVELEDEIYNLKTKLNSLRGDAQALTFKHAEIERLREREAEYEADLGMHLKLREWEKANMNEEAVREVEFASAEYETALSAARFGDRVADGEYCEELRQVYQRYIDDEKNYTIGIENMRRAEAELSREKQELWSFGELACADKFDAEADEKRAGEIVSQLGKKRFPAYLLAGIIIGALCAAGAFFMQMKTLMLPFAVAFAVIGIVCDICAAAKDKKRKAALENELDGILAFYAVGSASEIGERARACTDKKREVERCLEATAAVENNMMRSDLIRKESAKALLAAINVIDADATEADAPCIIETVRERADKLGAAKNKLDTAKVRLEAVKAGVGEAGESVSRPEGKMPEFSEEELNRRLGEVRGRLRELELDCSGLQARINQVGDQGDLQERLSERNERLREKNLEIEALEYAMEEISQVNGELARRFAPSLEKKAGEIFEYLTGGHFSVVEIRDAKMDVLVREESAAEARQVLELSQGTADELYLAMRLALSEILSEEEPIPLVLDDALVNFDDKRMAKALDYLNEVSKERQVILFTCQTREAEYAKKFSECTVRNL